MPELPEIETVRRGLTPRLEGRLIRRVIARRGDLRRPLPENFAARLEARAIIAIDRRAKYLILRLDDGVCLVVHLGMSGRLVIESGQSPADGRHDHVIFEIDDGSRLRFNDPRRFGLMDLVPAAELDQHPLFRHLGPDPFDAAFDGPRLAAALAGRGAPIKSLLMDQRVVAGLGNIYVCESLYRAGLSPRRGGGTIARARAGRLVESIRSVLEDAIAAGGSSLRDYVQASGELGYFQKDFKVYGRAGEACASGRSGHRVSRMVQANRSTFYCPRCQR